MKLAAKTDIGAVRRENQDDYRACRVSDDMLWAVVCDGMGGARGGREASRLGCDSAQLYFDAHLAEYEPGGEQAFLTSVLQYANSEIYALAKREPSLVGMGTTAVCALVRGGSVYLCHAGDSRCYLVHDGALYQLTHDHSYVQELVDCGTITAAEAEHHPQKNVITRALGVDRSVRPEYSAQPLAEGDVLLLCSDGLSNAVPAAEILRIIRRTPFYQTPAALIEAANFGGGTDNITALLIGMEKETENG